MRTNAGDTKETQLVGIYTSTIIPRIRVECSQESENITVTI